MLGVRVRHQFSARLHLCVRPQEVGIPVIEVPDTVIDFVAMTYSMLSLSTGGRRELLELLQKGVDVQSAIS